MVSLYEADRAIVVESVQLDERIRLESLDGLPDRIRKWEDECQQSPRSDVASREAGGS